MVSSSGSRYAVHSAYMEANQKDPFGLRALIASKGMTQAAFARAVGCTPQSLNNWFERGMPGSKVFVAADVLGMTADELRSYTAPGRQADTDFEAEMRRFRAMFARLSPAEQADVLRRLLAIHEK